MKKYDIISVDSFSQIFRCFYAMKNLRSKAGLASGAIFGMAKLLLKLHTEYPSKFGMMAYDSGKVQFRLELAPAYKANRPPMPEDLAAQMPFIEELITAFGWPIKRCKNFEADDIIGGVATHFPGKIAIISADKDLSQLVNERVEMLVPCSGGFEVRDTAAVREKFDVPPEMIVDYLALLGDASDNIPGVPGIGPKGAAKLLNEYGSLDKILSAPALVSNVKLAAKLIDNQEIIRKNQQLISLKLELPEDCQSLEEFCRREPDWQKIMNILQRFDLNSLVAAVKKQAGNQVVEVEPKSGGQLDLFADLPSKTPAAPAAEPEDVKKATQGLLF
ncbi:MAG: 5'-3' exonuclease H3TH domain-containing protein [Victivallaceae bacterium]